MTTVDLSWTPSSHARRLLSVVVLAVLAAVATGRAELLAVAGPPLLLLVVAARAPRPREAQVMSTVSPGRCLEGDEVELQVEVNTDSGVGQIRLEPAPAARLRVTADPRPEVSLNTSLARGTWALVVTRWGRWSAASLTLVLRDQSGLWQATAWCTVGEVIAYPQPAAMNRLVLPEHLQRRIGAHTSHSPGAGVEFAGIRPYVPGDPPRDIHWPASLRHGDLQVTQRAAERSADVVVALDAFSDVGGSLERSVRGCTGVARAYLRCGDRVGLAVLGGALKVLPPDTSQRTLYRITDEVLAVRRDNSVVAPHVDRIPRHALPARAVVVLFSPLLDDRSIETARDLRTRGTSVIVVDVLTTEPALTKRPTPTEELALRLWRLDRAALRQQLSDEGIRVAPWDAAKGLDEVLAPLVRQPPIGRR